MTTSVSRRLNILCILFNHIASFITKLFSWLYVRVGILLTCGRHLYNYIISLRGEVCSQTNSLSACTKPGICDVIYLCDTSYICVLRHIFVLGVSMLTLSTILIFDFGNVQTVWYFLFSISSVLKWLNELGSWIT